MKRFLNPCRRHHQNLSLLAAGALSEREENQVQDHLRECSPCRLYFQEIKTVTDPLANWAETLPQFQPSESARASWAKVIRAAGRPEPVRRLAPAVAFRDWAHEVFWPWRRVWAGVAAAWLVILAGNVSLRDPAPAITAKSAAPSQEAIASFRDQQKMLAELLPDHSAPRDAERQKFFSPKPRTERFRVFAV